MSEPKDIPTNKYLALTIGPIGKTLSNARKTRELWAASYIFSYLMKEIIRKIKDKKDYVFVIPNISGGLSEAFKDTSNRSKLYLSGAGLFPDRLIVKVPLEDTTALKDLKKLVKQVVHQLADDIATYIKVKTPSKVKEYIEDYFQIHLLEVDIPENANPILTIQPYLDSLELQRSYSLKQKNYLNNFFDWVTKSFLVKDAWEKDEFSFPTLIEIATKTFEPKDKEAIIDDFFKRMLKLERIKNPLVRVEIERIKNYATLRARKTYDELKKEYQRLQEDELKGEQDILKYLIEEYAESDTGNTFKTAHKYIAIVQADGDNVGNLIETLGNNAEELEKFSKKLSEFAAEAVEKIADYGGMPIYAGGDDLLFFAPVINAQSNLNNTTNIFELLKMLDTQFKALFTEFKVSPNPSLSFGLSISYYKFPLYEALTEAQNLLFGVAKSIEGKNTISFKVLKHSGQFFEANLQLTSDSVEGFELLLKNAVEKPKEQLSSIMYRIQENEAILKVIGKDYTAVKNFIHNSFNEDIHKGTTKDLIDNIAALIPIVYYENDNADAANQQLYSMLRTISFLTSTNSND